MRLSFIDNEVYNVNGLSVIDILEPISKFIIRYTLPAYCSIRKEVAS